MLFVDVEFVFNSVVYNDICCLYVDLVWFMVCCV